MSLRNLSKIRFPSVIKFWYIFWLSLSNYNHCDQSSEQNVDYACTFFCALKNERSSSKKAWACSKSILPPEPPSLVAKYTAGMNEYYELKLLLDASAATQKPAISSEKSISCSCNSKCATKRCFRKNSKSFCIIYCHCSDAKSKNKQDWKL